MPAIRNGRKIKILVLRSGTTVLQYLAVAVQQESPCKAGYILKFVGACAHRYIMLARAHTDLRSARRACPWLGCASSLTHLKLLTQECRMRHLQLNDIPPSARLLSLQQLSPSSCTVGDVTPHSGGSGSMADI